jgi:hypothetical protein
VRLKVLESYGSIAYRSIKVGLTARAQLFGDKPLIASSDHMKLLACRAANKGDTETEYVWAVMDGLFLATPTFVKYSSQGSFDAIKYLYVVGDLGGIDDLRNWVGRELGLLLDADTCAPMIRELKDSNPVTRLKFGILPSAVHTLKDQMKELRQLRRRPSVVERTALFAGNDGISPVLQMVATCVEEPLTDADVSSIKSSFAATAPEKAGGRNRTTALARRVSRAYETLQTFVRCRIERSRNREFRFYGPGISTILFKGVFRYACLQELKSLRLVETIHAPRNISVYNRAQFNDRLMLDFGGINGFEPLYPRSMECALYGKRRITVNEASRAAFDQGRVNVPVLEDVLVQLPKLREYLELESTLTDFSLPGYATVMEPRLRERR